MSRPFSLALCLLSLATFVSLFAGAASAADAGKYRVYFGTYTGQKSRGIYTADLDLATGKLTEPRLAAEAVSPSFLAIHPSGHWLYAVSEIDDLNGRKTGGVSAFAIEADGGLRLLNQQPSEGRGPCHVTVDPSGKFALVANYGSGSAAALPIEADGRLGPPSSVVQHEGKSVDPQRQEGPHAHSINLDAAGRYAFVADLGLDQVKIYRFDAQTGKLTPADPAFVTLAPGAGPRHFAFHPQGDRAYVNNEMTSTITALHYAPEAGALQETQTLSTLPRSTPGNSTAEVQVHPSGRFVYVSNRGHDSIAGYTIDPDNGRLTALGNTPTGGRTPRNFGIDPTGQYLLAANQGTDNVVVFKIDAKTGKLTPTGQEIAVGAPVCVKFLKLE
ncbi:MAG: lactonase family protein [Pirellulales bacterium]